MSLMSSDFNAYKWRHFPTIGKILKDKKASDHYQAYWFATESWFEKLAILAEIVAVVVEESQEDVMELAQSGSTIDVVEDLVALKQKIIDTRNFFDHLINRIESFEKKCVYSAPYEKAMKEKVMKEQEDRSRLNSNREG